jgi:short-subunit dehydrogenase
MKARDIMKNILITGASSGLGAEFAKQYGTTKARLFLTGRHKDRLSEVATICRSMGAEVHESVVNVSERHEMTVLVNYITSHYGLDLVIANAGIGLNWDRPQDIVNDYDVFDINCGGVVNTIVPCLPSMIQKKSGHIVIISSLAGLVPMPSAPSYSASKAAVRFYGEALRNKVAAFNIKVSVICPGFIKSRLTDANDFPMPFLMETEPAVKFMIEKIEQGKERITFPWQMALPLQIIGVLPSSLSSFILSCLPQKGTNKL